MATANVENSAAECTFKPVQDAEQLEMCWCEERCLLGKGSYGRVYKGKWKESQEGVTIDVAVKHPNDSYSVKYEIKTLNSVKGHPNILKFYEEITIKSPPSRYENLFGWMCFIYFNLSCCMNHYNLMLFLICSACFLFICFMPYPVLLY